MEPVKEGLREILKGLEGLEMLGQWEQSLIRDLRTRTEALLKSSGKSPGPEPPSHAPAP